MPKKVNMNKLHMLIKEGVTYSLVPTIGGTCLVPLFYKHIAELMEAGHCTFHTFEAVTCNTSAIIAEIDNKIVGFDFFDHDKAKRVAFDFFVYVDPDYRRRGIFTEIENCLYVLYAKANNINYIKSLVSINNETSIQASKKLGFELFISEHSPGYYECIHSTQ